MVEISLPNEPPIPADRGVAEAELALVCARADRELSELPKPRRDRLKAIFVDAVMAATNVGIFDGAEAALRADPAGAAE